MWKYAAANGVMGTPTAFINGVKLDSEPRSVTKWIDALNSIYESQYGVGEVASEW